MDNDTSQPTKKQSKARSRLNRDITSPESVSSSKKERTVSPRASSTRPTSKDKPFLSKYVAHVQTLILALSSWLLFAYILLSVYPEVLQNWLIPHIYLPLILVFFIANLFSFAFILLKTRRALTVSAALTTLLFFRLQQVVFTPQLVLGTLIFFGILELALTMLVLGWSLPTIVTRKSRANIKQKTRKLRKRTRS